jgi:hypothetical protein
MNFACENLNDSGTYIGSLASARSIHYRVSLGIPVLALLLLSVGEKNGLRCLRASSSHLLRPEDPQSSGPALRRPADLSGGGDPPCRMSKVRKSEAGKAGLAGRLSLLHEAVCLLRRPPLSGFEYFGYRQRASSGLAHGQSPGNAVAARTVAPGGKA